LKLVLLPQVVQQPLHQAVLLLHRIRKRYHASYLHRQHPQQQQQQQQHMVRAKMSLVAAAGVAAERPGDSRQAGLRSIRTEFRHAHQEPRTALQLGCTLQQQQLQQQGMRVVLVQLLTAHTAVSQGYCQEQLLLLEHMNSAVRVCWLQCMVLSLTRCSP
jgi:hypothetical protein